jgi:hypothetical protein
MLKTVRSMKRYQIPAYTVPLEASTSICIVGMNFIDPISQPPLHSDDVRLRMLGCVVQNCRIRSIGDHNTKQTEIYRSSDIRCNRCTRSAEANSWFADARVSDIFILDYYWLQSTYFVDSKDSHGYGAGWFKRNGNVMKMLGSSREAKTKIVLLPNDKWQLLVKMYSENQQLMDSEGIHMTLLTEVEARCFHPLVIATRAGFNESVWPVLHLNDAQFHRFDHDHGRMYLHSKPFILLYSKARGHSTREEAFAYLKNTLRDEYKC